MRDYKQIGIRLSQHEAKTIEQLARDNELTVSELVRLWLEQAARQATRG
jgi:transposase-like protein